MLLHFRDKFIKSFSWKTGKKTIGVVVVHALSRSKSYQGDKRRDCESVRVSPLFMTELDEASGYEHAYWLFKKDENDFSVHSLLENSGKEVLWTGVA
jgi:hypothetical protein